MSDYQARGQNSLTLFEETQSDTSPAPEEENQEKGVLHLQASIAQEYVRSPASSHQQGRWGKRMYIASTPTFSLSLSSSHAPFVPEQCTDQNLIMKESRTTKNKIDKIFQKNRFLLSVEKKPRVESEDVHYSKKKGFAIHGCLICTYTMCKAYLHIHYVQSLFAHALCAKLNCT